MKKSLLFVIISIFVSLELFADSSSRIYSFNDRLVSPLKSVAYHGEFLDFLSNPAALPLINKDEESFVVMLNGADDIPFSNLSEKVGYLNSRVDELSISFAGNNVAFTTNLGTSFTNRKINDDQVYFDINSNIDIEIDLGLAFHYLSVGMSIKGGNSMIRHEKPISDVFDIVSNALFSPFENNPNSERFSLGAGLLLYLNNFSLGLNIDDILFLDDNSELSASWETVAKSTDIAFAANGNKFTKNGDLQFLLPRVSVSYSSFVDKEYTFSIKGDIAFQFLPDCNLDIGVGYREADHSFLSFKSENGNLDVYMKAKIWSFSVTLGTSFDTESFSYIAPFIGFAYIG